MKTHTNGSTHAIEEIIATMHEPVIVIDENLRVISANDSFYRLFSTDPPRAEERMIFELDGNQLDIPELWRLVEEIVATKKELKEYPLRLRFKDGEKQFLINARRMQWQSDQPAILLAMRATTESLPKRKFLVNEEALLQTLLDTIAEGIIVTDADHVVRLTGRYTGTLLGIDPRQLIGTNESEWLKMLDLYREDGSKIMHTNELPLFKAAMTGKACEPMALILKHNGIEKNISLTAAPVIDNEGAVAGVVSGWHDVTASKRMPGAMTDPAKFPEENPNPVVRLTSEGTLLYCNKASKEVFSGWPCGIGSVVPDSWRATVLEAYAVNKQKSIDVPCGERVLSLTIVPIRENGYVNVYAQDISSRVRAEQELRRAHDLIQSVMRGTEDMIAAVDLEFRYTYFNESYSREFKKLWKREIGVGTSMVEAMAPWPGEQQKARELWARALSGESFAVIMQFGPTEPKKQYYDLHFNPLQDERGKVIGAAHFLRNVTEETLTRQRLRESEEKFAKTFYHSPAMITLSAVEDGRFIDVNDTFCNISGYSREELLGNSSMELGIITPQMREESLVQLKREGKIVLQDSKMYVRNGDLRDTIYSTDIIQLRGKSVLLITAVDVTERRLSQEAVLKSERRLKRSQEIAHLGSWELDLTTNTLTWSDEVYRIFGLEPQEFKATYEAFIDAVHPKDRAAVDAAYTNSLAAGKSGYEIDHRVVRKKSHEVRYVHEKCEHFKDENGHVYLSVGMVHDITERKRAELELMCRSQELAAANEELESFSYSVSHDLRNPLNTIAAFTSILLEGYEQCLDENGREILYHILGGVQKMRQIIEHLLKLSHIGRKEINRRNTNLSALVQSILHELKESDRNRNVRFVVKESVHARVDPQLMQLALENLLRNAWKFTEKEDIAHIEFGTSEQNGRKIFYIRDNGAGFDMHHARKIFEPFIRGHSEKEFVGTGVGLAIVQRVIERHGGEIWAEGEVGNGATFFFTLG